MGICDYLGNAQKSIGDCFSNFYRITYMCYYSLLLAIDEMFISTTVLLVTLSEDDMLPSFSYLLIFFVHNTLSEHLVESTTPTL
jgi:hypothetical protein